MLQKQKLFLVSFLSLGFLTLLYFTFPPMMSSLFKFLEADACLDAGGSLKNAKGICLIQAPDGSRVLPWKLGAILLGFMILVSCLPALLAAGVIVAALIKGGG